MAVSKHQNERPAINALIDFTDGLETAVNAQTTQISNLRSALASEVSSRSNADTLLANQIQSEVSTRSSADASLESAIDAEETARETAIASIYNTFGSVFSESYSVSDFADSVTSDIDSLQDLQSSLKFGIGSSATVQGNDYYDGTVTYETPYPNPSNSFVIPAFLSGVEQSDLEVTVSECDHEGFSYTVVNRSATEKSFVIGYIAFGQAILN